MANTVDTMTPEALLRGIIDGSLTEFIDDDVTWISLCKFRKHSGLKNVILPNLQYLRSTSTSTQENQSIGAYFYDAWIKYGYFPKLEKIYGVAAFYCGIDTDGIVVLPSLANNLIYSAFRESANIITVDIGPELKGLTSDCFYKYGASATQTLILRRTDSIVTTSNTDTILRLAHVYVPQDLITSYQTATNWSTRYNNGILQFHAIEGSQYEYYYADGTPIPQNITATYTNCGCTNSATNVDYGSSYTATLTADDGYTLSSVVVTMGGIDVTSTVYNSTTRVISIANVSGPITITATAT